MYGLHHRRRPARLLRGSRLPASRGQRVPHCLAVNGPQSSIHHADVTNAEKIDTNHRFVIRQASALLPTAKFCRRARANQGQALAGGRASAASLERPCARAAVDFLRSGRKMLAARVEQKMWLWMKSAGYLGACGSRGSLASPLYPEGGTGPIGSEPLDSLEHRVAPMGKELGAIKHQSDGDLFAGREETYVFSVLLDLRHHGGDAPLDLGTHGPLPRWSRAP